MGRPRTKHLSAKLTVQLSVPQKMALEEIATGGAAGTNVSDIIRVLIEDFLNQPEYSALYQRCKVDESSSAYDIPITNPAPSPTRKG